MSEYYYELIIQPQSKYDVFLDLLLAITNEAIEEDNGKMIARSEENLDNVKFGMEKLSQALNIPCEIVYEKKENIDWIKQYQDSVKSVQVGNFFIRPSWEEKKDDKIDIIINPALSFGSGHHETTSSCIEAIDKYVFKDNSVLDVGCGSGILSIASAKKEALVDICDTDEVCIKDSLENAKLNNVQFNTFWIGSVNKTDKKYDIVIANIVADVLVMISKDLKKHLKDDGILIISGILDKHISKVLKKFEDLEQLELIHKNEWITVVFKNK